MCFGNESKQTERMKKEAKEKQLSQKAYGKWQLFVSQKKQATEAGKVLLNISGFPRPVIDMVKDYISAAPRHKKGVKC